MHKIIYLGIVLIGLASCKTTEVPFYKKRINTQTHKEVFSVTDKRPIPQLGVQYHWFKSRKIQTTQGGYAGELLDGAYTQYYHSNELITKGNYKKGKKVGLWKNWYKNGKVERIENWRGGIRSGKMISFDSLGNVLFYGKYRNNKRYGKWVFVQKKDTLYYDKQGVVIDKENDTLRSNFFYRIFKKKNKDTTASNKKQNFFTRLFSKKNKNTKNVQKKNKNNLRPSNRKKEKQHKTEKKKSNFFQRLFKKKDKKKDNK